MRQKLELAVILPDNVPPGEVQQWQNISQDRLAEVLISGLFANGLITSQAAMHLMQQSRREFYEMLQQNRVPLSSPETDEDLEENRAIYSRKL